MGKRDGAHLDVIEEWTPINPSDPQALAQEGQNLRLIMALLLKAHEREILERARYLDRKHERIRRKAGLAA